MCFCGADAIWQGNNNETWLLRYHWPGPQRPSPLQHSSSSTHTRLRLFPFINRTRVRAGACAGAGADAQVSAVSEWCDLVLSAWVTAIKHHRRTSRACKHSPLSLSCEFISTLPPKASAWHVFPLPSAVLNSKHYQFPYCSPLMPAAAYFCQPPGCFLSFVGFHQHLTRLKLGAAGLSPLCTRRVWL